MKIKLQEKSKFKQCENCKKLKTRLYPVYVSHIGGYCKFCYSCMTNHTRKTLESESKK